MSKDESKSEQSLAEQKRRVYVLNNTDEGFYVSWNSAPLSTVPLKPGLNEVTQYINAINWVSDDMAKYEQSGQIEILQTCFASELLSIKETDHHKSPQSHTEQKTRIYVFNNTEDTLSLPFICRPLFTKSDKISLNPGMNDVTVHRNNISWGSLVTVSLEQRGEILILSTCCSDEWRKISKEDWTNRIFVFNYWDEKLYLPYILGGDYILDIGLNEVTEHDINWESEVVAKLEKSGKIAIYRSCSANELWNMVYSNAKRIWPDEAHAKETIERLRHLCIDPELIKPDHHKSPQSETEESECDIPLWKLMYHKTQQIRPQSHTELSRQIDELRQHQDTRLDAMSNALSKQISAVEHSLSLFQSIFIAIAQKVTLLCIDDEE